MRYGVQKYCQQPTESYDHESNLSNFFKIRNIDKRISQRLNQDKLGIIFDSSFNFFQIVNIYKSCCNTIAWKSFF